MIQRLANDLGYTLDEDDLADYESLVAAIVSAVEDVITGETPPFAPEHVSATDTRSSQRADPRKNPHNAWITRCRVAGASSGPLADRSVGLKDVISLAGVEMTAGSAVLEGYVPTADASVVTRLLEAGATITGKTNMESFAFSSTSQLSDFGTVTNPSADGIIAGGSSSGSAVAVAADEVDIALGTDQGGSIRMPASMSGIVGHKPTHGLVPYTGILPMEPSIDHVGPMTRSVQAAAETLDVIAGSDGLDARQPCSVPDEGYTAAVSDPSIEDWTVGVLEEGFSPAESDDAVIETVRKTVDRLADAGASVESVSVHDHHRGPSIWAAVGGYGAWRVLQQGGAPCHLDGWYDTQQIERFEERRDAHTDSFPPTVMAAMLAQQYVHETVGMAAYAHGRNATLALRSAYDRALSEVDVLVMPTVPVESYDLAAKERQSFADWFSRCGLVPLGLNTCPFNLTGHPAISVPSGRANNKPVGTMIVGRQFEDGTVLEVAAELESVVPE